MYALALDVDGLSRRAGFDPRVRRHNARTPDLDDRTANAEEGCRLRAYSVSISGPGGAHFLMSQLIVIGEETAH